MLSSDRHQLTKSGNIMSPYRTGFCLQMVENQDNLLCYKLKRSTWIHHYLSFSEVRVPNLGMRNRFNLALRSSVGPFMGCVFEGSPPWIRTHILCVCMCIESLTLFCPCRCWYQMVVLVPGRVQCGWWFRYWMKMTTSPHFLRRCTKSNFQRESGERRASPSIGYSPTTVMMGPIATSPTPSWTATRTGNSSSTPRLQLYLHARPSLRGATTSWLYVTFITN